MTCTGKTDTGWEKGNTINPMGRVLTLELSAKVSCCFLEEPSPRTGLLALPSVV